MKYALRESVQTRNREPDVRAKVALEFVHTDLAGPIDPVSINDYRYAVSFTDDYSSAVFLYFLNACVREETPVFTSSLLLQTFSSKLSLNLFFEKLLYYFFCF